MRARLHIIVVLGLLGATIVAWGEEFHDAVSRGDLAAVKKYLQEDPSRLSRQTTRENTYITPLSLAIRSRQDAVAHFLINKRTNINEGGHSGVSPLFDALFSGQLEMAKALIDAGADVDHRSGQRSLLHYAASSSNKQVAEFLLERGADVSLQDRHGATPLHRVPREIRRPACCC